MLGLLLKTPQWVKPMAAGFSVGYPIYELTQYATHHFPPRHGYARYIERYHMAHQYNPDKRYGVSSSFGDWMFGTAGA